ILVKEATDKSKVSQLLQEIDLGESEAIVLVEELEAHLLIIDERLGTRIAKNRGILTIGLLGILVKAKVDGHLKEIRPLLDQLQSIGFWIRNELKERILASVSE
ncbi:MAG: DUF3368 domain-containing protein, partial [Bacteroidota bacterium]